MFRKLLLLASVFCIAETTCLEYVRKVFLNKETKQKEIVPKVKVVSLYGDFNWVQARNTLYEVAKNKDIHAIILDVDNTGGGAEYFGLLHDLIKDVTKIKPVVAFVQGYALSGGYMLVSSANYILASSLSAVGSIGVYKTIEKRSGLSKDGNDKEIKADTVEIEFIKAGIYKAIENPFSPSLTEIQKEYLQADVDAMYHNFINLVAEDRNLDKEESGIWAEGKVFTGIEALELGLIDQIGTVLDVDSVVLSLLKKRDSKSNFADTIKLIM